MDENQDSSEMTQQAPEEKTPEVGFPPIPQPKVKTGTNRLILIGLILLILIGGGIFLFSRGAKEEQTGISPTPTTQGVETISPTETPTPTAVDKSKVAIEVQNGTGITGEAAYLQGLLKSLGYSNIKVGNADDQNQTVTTVTFAKSLSSTFVDEITKKLEDAYKDVETKTSSTQKVDVLIVTGLKKGATPKPTTTATPTPTKTPTATPTATPT